jgi:nucleotide-binding universal stress UspA family protein
MERMRTEPHPPRAVVGVDGSRSSEHALRWALDWARAHGGLVEAVHVVDTTAGLSYAMNAVPYEHYTAAVRRSLARTVARAAVGRTDVPCALTIDNGRPAAVLIKHARGADLLVVGDRGRRPVVGALLGSVGRACVFHAPCPVVVVPGPRPAGSARSGGPGIGEDVAARPRGRQRTA